MFHLKVSKICCFNVIFPCFLSFCLPYIIMSQLFASSNIKNKNRKLTMRFFLRIKQRKETFLLHNIIKSLLFFLYLKISLIFILILCLCVLQYDSLFYSQLNLNYFFIIEIHPFFPPRFIIDNNNKLIRSIHLGHMKEFLNQTENF